MHDLQLLLKAGIPLINLQTRDEKHALQMLTRLAMAQSLAAQLWTVTDGLRPLGFNAANPASNSNDSSDPTQALQTIRKETQATLYVLCDFHPFLHLHNENHVVVTRLLKDIALAHEELGHSLVLLSHHLTLPEELTHLSAKLQLSFPSEEEVMAMIREEAGIWSAQNAGKKVKTDYNTLKQLHAHIGGLSHFEVRRMVRAAIVEDGAISETDLPHINKARFELLNMDGVLSYEFDTVPWSDVAGMNKLASWLELRKQAFIGGGNDDRPKGLLLTGVQGAGKSMAAKAVANIWQLPLLRLDIASLYNKFIGETEKNLRDALQLAEAMAPCVLWIDELEKALASSHADGGTSRRILGTLLTWMAERQDAVFVVATSNEIRDLPPELLRKGRFDEIFFVDLPDHEARQHIFRIHLLKREQTIEALNLEKLAQSAEGFTGAEIEQGIIAALYQCAAAKETLTTEHIVQALEQTVPLSVLMQEEILALRHWCASRTVAAH